MVNYHDKEAKNTQWIRTIISLINIVGKTGSHMQKNETGPLTPYTKNKMD